MTGFPFIQKKMLDKVLLEILGMSHATGEYIAFVDADDVRAQVEMYRALIGSAKEFDADLVFGV